MKIIIIIIIIIIITISLCYHNLVAKCMCIAKAKAS